MDQDVHLASGLDGPALAPSGEMRTGRAGSGLLDLSEFIIAHPTATFALEQWRRQRGFGTARITAVLLAGVRPVAVDAALAADLELAPDVLVLERRVALEHGTTRLAIAVNWFVPDRLPLHIRMALQTGEVPFGTLINPLGGYRVHLTARVNADGPQLQHRAIVCLGGGRRVAVVEERFLAAILDRAR